MYVISWRETAAIFQALCGESMLLKVAFSECLSILNPLRIWGRRKKNTEMESPYLTDTLTDRLKWNPIWGIEEWIADTVTLVDSPIRSQAGSTARHVDKKGCKYWKIGMGQNCGWGHREKILRYWNEASHFGLWCWLLPVPFCGNHNVTGSTGKGLALIVRCESICIIYIQYLLLSNSQIQAHECDLFY